MSGFRGGCVLARLHEHFFDFEVLSFVLQPSPVAHICRKLPEFRPIHHGSLLCNFLLRCRHVSERCRIRSSSRQTTTLNGCWPLTASVCPFVSVPYGTRDDFRGAFLRDFSAVSQFSPEKTTIAMKRDLFHSPSTLSSLPLTSSA